MMETKHTPAPWKVRFFNKDEPESGFFVEAANNNKPELGYGIEILMEDFGEHNGYPFEQRLADAKLIAAGPEMLDALVHAEMEITTLYERIGYANSNILKLIRKAIQKATQ